MQYTVYKQGEEITFTPKFDTPTALLKLKELAPQKKSSFGCDLARKKSHSEKQLAWVHFLVNEWTTNPAHVKPQTVEVEARNIYDFLHTPEKLLTPRVTIGDIQFKNPGAKSKNAGFVYVSYKGQYKGKFDINMNFKGNMTDEIKELIAEIDLDVLGAIKAEGHKSGNCCLCSRKLTDDDSLFNGYGKRCSENYKLPYEKATFRINKA